MLEGIFAVISTSFELLGTRKILRSGKYKSEKFITAMFIGVVVLMLPIILTFSNFSIWPIKYYFLFLLILLVATTYNILYFKSLKRIDVEDAQPIILSTWVFTIIFAFIFLPDERNIVKVVLALIASLTLIITEMKGKKLIIGKWEKMMLIAVILIGFYNLLTKIILDVISPFSLYFLRTLILLPIFIKISSFKHRDFKKYSNTLIISFLSIISQVSTFLAYKNLGLITTSLLMTSTPILTFWGAHIFLGEKIKYKNVISSVIILLCIIVSLFV